MDGTWRGADLPLTDKDAAAWQKAEQEIRANRCGGLILRVVDGNGRPLAGVPVRYEQRRHAFRFGVQYPYHAPTYDLLQAAGINAATLWLGWKHVEPEPGLFNRTYLDRVWNPAALHQRGLRLTAHALNWFKPGWGVLPDYLRDTPATQLPRLVYDHVSELVRHWAPYIETYELVNEPFWAEANAIPLGMEDMVRICHATALAVRDLAPRARLEINLTEIARTTSYYIRPDEFLHALDEAQVPYDSLGLQIYDNAYTATRPPTYYRTKTLSMIVQAVRKYVLPGKTLHISALAVPSAGPLGKAPSHYKVRYGAPWTEEIQAAYLDAIYTLLFAEPEIEGITWWCPVDGRLAYVAHGGLLRADLSCKPAYHALKQWVARHTATGQGYTDAEGKLVIRSFAGEYDLTVGAGAAGKPITQEIEARGGRDCTVVLDHRG